MRIIQVQSTSWVHLEWVARRPASFDPGVPARGTRTVADARHAARHAVRHAVRIHALIAAALVALAIGIRPVNVVAQS